MAGLQISFFFRGSICIVFSHTDVRVKKRETYTSAISYITRQGTTYARRDIAIAKEESEPNTTNHNKDVGVVIENSLTTRPSGLQDTASVDSAPTAASGPPSSSDDVTIENRNVPTTPELQSMEDISAADKTAAAGGGGLQTSPENFQVSSSDEVITPHREIQNATTTTTTTASVGLTRTGHSSIIQTADTSDSTTDSLQDDCNGGSPPDAPNSLNQQDNDYKNAGDLNSNLNNNVLQDNATVLIKDPTLSGMELLQYEYTHKSDTVDPSQVETEIIEPPPPPTAQMTLKSVNFNGSKEDTPSKKSRVVFV